MSIPKRQLEQPQGPSREEIDKALDAFRRSLEDVRDVVTALGVYCSTPDELLSVVELGIVNDAQLRLLLSEITSAKPRGE